MPMANIESPLFCFDGICGCDTDNNEALSKLLILALSSRKKKNNKNFCRYKAGIGLNKLPLQIYKISFHIHFSGCENHLQPPSSLPPSLPPSLPSQSLLVNMSGARIRDPISGDSGRASEAVSHCWISQNRLTGERGGGRRDGKWMSSVFLCCHSDLSQASWAPSCICFIRWIVATEAVALWLRYRVPECAWKYGHKRGQKIESVDNACAAVELKLGPIVHMLLNRMSACRCRHKQNVFLSEIASHCLFMFI